MEKMYWKFVWETELETLIKLFESKKSLKKKKKIKLKTNYKYYKLFLKPSIFSVKSLSWKTFFSKNLKKYFFKWNLRKTYEREILQLTTKHRRLLRYVVIKGNFIHFLILQNSNRKLTGYKRLLFYYTWQFFNKKLIYLLYK